MEDKVNAVWKTVQQMKKNLECSICLELLKDPYSTSCNHQFCRQCIYQVLDKNTGQKKIKCSCPLCKAPMTRRSLMPNPQLSAIMTAVRHLCEAVQKDTGVAGSPPPLFMTSAPISGTPGCALFHELHPTPQKGKENAQQVLGPKSTAKAIDVGEKTKGRDKVEIFIDSGAEDDAHSTARGQVITNTNISTSFPSAETTKNTQKSKPTKQPRRVRRSQRKVTKQRRAIQAEESNWDLLHVIDTMPLGVPPTADNHGTVPLAGCPTLVLEAGSSLQGPGQAATSVAGRTPAPDAATSDKRESLAFGDAAVEQSPDCVVERGGRHSATPAVMAGASEGETQGTSNSKSILWSLAKRQTSTENVCEVRGCANDNCAEQIIPEEDDGNWVSDETADIREADCDHDKPGALSKQREQPRRKGTCDAAEVQRTCQELGREQHHVANPEATGLSLHPRSQPVYSDQLFVETEAGSSSGPGEDGEPDKEAGKHSSRESGGLQGNVTNLAAQSPVSHREVGVASPGEGKPASSPDMYERVKARRSGRGTSPASRGDRLSGSDEIQTKKRSRGSRTPLSQEGTKSRISPATKGKDSSSPRLAEPTHVTPGRDVGSMAPSSPEKTFTGRVSRGSAKSRISLSRKAKSYPSPGQSEASHVADKDSFAETSPDFTGRLSRGSAKSRISPSGRAKHSPSPCRSGTMQVADKDAGPMNPSSSAETSPEFTGRLSRGSVKSRMSLSRKTRSSPSPCQSEAIHVAGKDSPPRNPLSPGGDATSCAIQAAGSCRSPLGSSAELVPESVSSVGSSGACVIDPMAAHGSEASLQCTIPDARRDGALVEVDGDVRRRRDKNTCTSVGNVLEQSPGNRQRGPEALEDPLPEVLESRGRRRDKNSCTSVGNVLDLSPGNRGRSPEAQDDPLPERLDSGGRRRDKYTCTSVGNQPELSVGSERKAPEPRDGPLSQVLGSSGRPRNKRPLAPVGTEFDLSPGSKRKVPETHPVTAAKNTGSGTASSERSPEIHIADARKAGLPDEVASSGNAPKSPVEAEEKTARQPQLESSGSSPSHADIGRDKMDSAISSCLFNGGSYESSPEQFAESEPFPVSGKGMNPVPPSTEESAADGGGSGSPAPSTNWSTDDCDRLPGRWRSSQGSRGTSPHNTPSQATLGGGTTACLFGTNDSCRRKESYPAGEGTLPTTTAETEHRLDDEAKSREPRTILGNSRLAMSVEDTQEFNEHSASVSDNTTQSVSLLCGLEIPDEAEERQTSPRLSAGSLKCKKAATPCGRGVRGSPGFKTPILKPGVDCSNASHVVDLTGETQDSDIIPPTPPVLKSHVSYVPSRPKGRPLSSSSCLKNDRGSGEGLTTERSYSPEKKNDCEYNAGGLLIDEDTRDAGGDEQMIGRQFPRGTPNISESSLLRRTREQERAIVVPAGEAGDEKAKVARARAVKRGNESCGTRSSTEKVRRTPEDTQGIAEGAVWDAGLPRSPEKGHTSQARSARGRERQCASPSTTKRTLDLDSALSPRERKLVCVSDGEEVDMTESPLPYHSPRSQSRKGSEPRGLVCVSDGEEVDTTESPLPYHSPRSQSCKGSEPRGLVCVSDGEGTDTTESPFPYHSPRSQSLKGSEPRGLVCVSDGEGADTTESPLPYHSPRSQSRKGSKPRSLVCVSDGEEGGAAESPLPYHSPRSQIREGSEPRGGTPTVHSSSKAKRLISCFSWDDDRQGSDSEEESLLKPVFLPPSLEGPPAVGGSADRATPELLPPAPDDDDDNASHVSCSEQMTNRSSTSFLSEGPTMSTQKVELLRKNVHETEEEIIALRALLLDMEKAQEVEAEPDHSHEASQDAPDRVCRSPCSPTPPSSSLTPENVPPVPSLPSPVEAIARLLREVSSEEEEEEEEAMGEDGAEKTAPRKLVQKALPDQELQKGRRVGESGTVKFNHDGFSALTKRDRDGESAPRLAPPLPPRAKRLAHDSEDDLSALANQEPAKPAASATKRRRLIDDTGSKRSPVVSFLFRESAREGPARSPSSATSGGMRASLTKRRSEGREGGQTSPRDTAADVSRGRKLEEGWKRVGSAAKSNDEGRSFSFVATRLNREHLNAVRRFAETWGGKLAREFNSKTTHVVMATDCKMQVTRSSYTMKYLLALALGKWIVSHQWVTACLEAKSILPEEEYEVRGDLALHQSRSPRLARTARERQDRSLFAEFRVLCVGNFTSSITKGQLTQLLDACGAEVCRSAADMADPAPHQKRSVLIADKTDKEGARRNRGLFRRLSLLPVSLEWVTDSIANYRIQDMNEYVIPA